MVFGLLALESMCVLMYKTPLSRYDNMIPPGEGCAFTYLYIPRAIQGLERVNQADIACRISTCKWDPSTNARPRYQNCLSVRIMNPCADASPDPHTAMDFVSCAPETDFDPDPCPDHLGPAGVIATSTAAEISQHWHSHP